MGCFPKLIVSCRRWACLAALGLALPAAWAATTNVVTVSLTPAPVNVFSPYDALGAGVDVLFGLDPAVAYSPTNLAQMLAAGHGALTYRLNTELGVVGWHWNPAGTWSDTNGGGQGYFTGTTNPGAILHSYEFELPHRGFSTDQQGSARYSRLTDGDTATYWKSNPYLSAPFTGEPDAQHPQWVVIKLGSVAPMDALRIQWANPFATTYQAQYWVGTDNPMTVPDSGTWQNFPLGVITNAAPGSVTNLLAPAPLSVQFIRLLLTASSSTCDTHGAGDTRNCQGYAIGELYAGTLTSNVFTDIMVHLPGAGQTVTFVSSVDPWHTSSNQVVGIEQPGLDFIFTNGLTRGLPALVPVSLLYGTPADAVAQISYLRSRGYLISGIELGEEPDGQSIAPEDYGALYLQWATALHALDPSLKLGGPVLQDGNQDVKAWPDGVGETSWLKRFLNYLSAHGRLADLSFMSYEHYTFDPCADPWTVLAQTPTLVRNSLDHWRADGLPATVPIFCTEYNYSYDHSAVMPDLAGAVWQADFIGSFLTAGGAAAYYFQYQPMPLLSAADCASWGAFSMFKADASGQILARTAQFYSTELICQRWAQPGRQPHYVFPAHSDLLDGASLELITAYALVRPDGRWSLLLVNKDNAAAHYVHVQFSNTVTAAVSPLFNPVDVYQYGSAQYVWHANGTNGSASPNLPPAFQLVTNPANAAVLLPAGSITVLRAAGPAVVGVNASVGLTNGSLVLDYIRAGSTNGVTYTPEVSTNLTTWLAGSNFVQQTVLVSNVNTQQVRARNLLPITNAPAGYLRLKVSSP